MTGVLEVLYENEDGWQYLQQGLELAAFDGRRSVSDVLRRPVQPARPRRQLRAAAVLLPGDPLPRLPGRQRRRRHEREAAEKAKRAPTLGPYAGADLICPLWPVAPAPSSRPSTAKGAAPILVVGTTGDPATPYEYAERMARQLDSGHLLTLKGEGHLGYGQSACVRRYVQTYLLDGARAGRRHPLLTLSQPKACASSAAEDSLCSAGRRWRAWSEPRARGTGHPGPRFGGTPWLSGRRRCRRPDQDDDESAAQPVIRLRTVVNLVRMPAAQAARRTFRASAGLLAIVGGRARLRAVGVRAGRLSSVVEQRTRNA